MLSSMKITTTIMQDGGQRGQNQGQGQSVQLIYKALDGEIK